MNSFIEDILNKISIEFFKGIANTTGGLLSLYLIYKVFIEENANTTKSTIKIEDSFELID